MAATSPLEFQFYLSAIAFGISCFLTGYVLGRERTQQTHPSEIELEEKQKCKCGLPRE